MVLADQLYDMDEKLDNLKELAYENNDDKSLELIESLQRDTNYNKALDRIVEVLYGFRPGEWIDKDFYYEMDKTSNSDKFDLIKNELDILLNMRMINNQDYEKLYQVSESVFLSF